MRLIVLCLILLSVFAAPVALATDLQQAMRLLEGGKGKEAGAALQSLAELGSPVAQRVLGEALVKGNGLPKDEVSGLGWLLAAQDNGSEEVAALIEAVKPGLTEEQRAQAQAYVSQYGREAIAKQLAPVNEGPHSSPSCAP